MSADWRIQDEPFEVPLNPLQHRQEELINAYRRHGYPERADYLERMGDGPLVVRRLLQDRRPARFDEAVMWWTGWSTDQARQLRLACEQAARLGRQVQADAPAAETLVRQRTALLRTAREQVEDALVEGLAARVNTRLRPVPSTEGTFAALSQSPDWLLYVLLAGVREWACGSKLEAQAPLRRWELPPPHHEARSAHLIVCSSCTTVDLRRRWAATCKLCRKRHQRDGIVVSKTELPGVPWLITGYRHVHLHTCAECNEPLFGNRDAQMHDRCRVRRSRRLATAALGSNTQ